MNFLKTTIVCAAMAASASTFATTINLTNAGSNGYSWARSYLADDGVALTITAYNGGYVNTSNKEVGADITRREIGAYGTSGLGIERTGAPDHAADNASSSFDMFLLTFDRQVSLNSLSLGWYQNDSDMSVLAYTGNGNATSSFAGNKWDQALASNWTGGHYLNVAQKTNKTTALNPAEVKSSSWLVGPQLWSLTSLFTSGTANAGPTGVDYVKLKSISYTVASVPEIDGAQAGLAFGLLIALMAAFRERRQSRKSKI